MEYEAGVARRSLIKGAARIAAMIPVAEMVTPAAAAETGQEAQVTRLAEAQLGPNTKLTIELRDQVALFGINRPYIQNRIDPETFQALAKAYYDYDHDPSLRAAILFGHGDNFSRGIDVDGFKALVGTGRIGIKRRGPAYGRPLPNQPLLDQNKERFNDTLYPAVDRGRRQLVFRGRGD